MKASNVIWIRTAKTAGTSLQSALADLLLHDGSVPHFEECPPEGFLFPEDRVICLAPDRTDVVPEFIRVHGAVWRQSLKFGVVRNPYDRFISGWKYLEATRHRPLRDVLLDLPQSGHDFVHLTLRQVDHLAVDGTLLDIRLVHFENLQLEMNELFDELGIERRQIPFLHKTFMKDRPYMEYYDEETLQLVAERYRDDFELLGYSV